MLVSLLVIIITNITLQECLWYRGGGSLRGDWWRGQECTRGCSGHCGQVQPVWPGGLSALLEPETTLARLLQLYQWRRRDGRIYVIKYQHFILMIQVLLVTGGAHRPGGTWTWLDSTEILETSGGSWRTLTTARLPSPRYGPRAGTANNIVFVFGKNCLNGL